MQGKGVCGQITGISKLKYLWLLLPSNEVFTLHYKSVLLYLLFLLGCHLTFDSLVAQMVKNLPAVQEYWVQSLGREDSLEKRIVTHSNILAWRIPRTEEPDRLQSMGSKRVWHYWGTNTFTFHCTINNNKIPWVSSSLETQFSLPFFFTYVLFCRNTKSKHTLKSVKKNN